MPNDVCRHLICSATVRPAYIAGVTNPIFEASRAWDVLLDIGSGTVTVAKDIHATFPVSAIAGLGGPLVSRTGTGNLKPEGSLGEDDLAKPGTKSDFVVKADNNADNLFIEDVSLSPHIE